MKKKGAVELSMTTIIIIVIGITILSLGLVWIRGVFEDVGTTTSSAFDQADTEIGEIFGGTDQAVALSPSEIRVDQGGSGSANLAVNNLGSSSVTVTGTVDAIATGGGSADTLGCYFSNSLTGELASSTLESGHGVNNLKVYVEDGGSNLGSYGCKVTLNGLEEGEQIITLIVQIE
jgi:hypothetical protein